MLASRAPSSSSLFTSAAEDEDEGEGEDEGRDEDSRVTAGRLGEAAERTCARRLSPVGTRAATTAGATATAETHPRLVRRWCRGSACHLPAAGTLAVVAMYQCACTTVGNLDWTLSRQVIG